MVGAEEIGTDRISIMNSCQTVAAHTAGKLRKGVVRSFLAIYRRGSNCNFQTVPPRLFDGCGPDRVPCSARTEYIYQKSSRRIAVSDGHAGSQAFRSFSLTCLVCATCLAPSKCRLLLVVTNVRLPSNPSTTGCPPPDVGRWSVRARPEQCDMHLEEVKSQAGNRKCRSSNSKLSRRLPRSDVEGLKDVAVDRRGRSRGGRGRAE